MKTVRTNASFKGSIFMRIENNAVTWGLAA